MAQVTISRQPDYSDLDLDFMINPVTGDINKKTGTDAVKRSIRNLIFTNYYERPFKSSLGSDVPRLLFDNVDIITASLLEDAIVKLINTFEPRVRLMNVKAIADIDNGGFTIRMEYIILNTETDFQTDLGWEDNMMDFETEVLNEIINPLINYETIRYINKPYSVSGLTQTDIWFYFYFVGFVVFVVFIVVIIAEGIFIFALFR